MRGNFCIHEVCIGTPVNFGGMQSGNATVANSELPGNVQ
jgi:hypothetical protein